MSYRLFGPHTEVIGTYPSLESCQQHARSDNRNGIRWQGPADHGPQGAAKHWYGSSEKEVWKQGARKPEREYMIVEWPESRSFKLIDFEDFNGCGPIYPADPGYDTIEENEILYYNGSMPVYSAYRKKSDAAPSEPDTSGNRDDQAGRDADNSDQVHRVETGSVAVRPGDPDAGSGTDRDGSGEGRGEDRWPGGGIEVGLLPDRSRRDVVGGSPTGFPDFTLTDVIDARIIARLILLEQPFKPGKEISIATIAPKTRKVLLEIFPRTHRYLEAREFLGPCAKDLLPSWRVACKVELDDSESRVTF